jgi:tetratricopeptide (TPR) repeat protein
MGGIIVLPELYNTPKHRFGVFCLLCCKYVFMKKVILSVALLIWVGSVAAQPGKKPTALSAGKKNPHLAVFMQSAMSGDVATAISALNYYVSEQNGSTPYADTLALLYMQQGSYGQCYYWANRRLKETPDNVSLMEMKAISLDKLQQPTEAIALFEQLFKKSQSPFHAYKLMELQYGLKRLIECVATAQAAERLTYKPEYIMPYSVGEQNGRTYLQAGVYNVHALALYDLDRKAEAKQYLEKALGLDSTFLLAKQNLEAIRAIEAGGSKATEKPNAPGAPPANKQ